jgi:hypothetical protein
VAAGIGLQQDVSTAIPLVAIIDAAMLPFDEVLLGATPVAVIFEGIRRTKGYDITGWFQWLIGLCPTWVLMIGLSTVVSGLTGFDIYVAIPGVGMAGLPWQLADQWLLGLPMLLVARELYLRHKAKNQSSTESVRIDVPTSSTAGE